MRKEIKTYEEALEVLKGLKIDWVTTNKIRNSLWVNGVAFFAKNHRRIAYYDEANNLLSIN